MTLSAGTRLGHYEIVSPIGVGGMGEVYRARDSKLGRSVAIKVLSLLATDKEKMERLRQEAKLLASLNHPNIASIYGFEDSGQPGLVMELVEGPTLADRIARGPLPLEEALPIAKQVCEALEYAHDRGIVHRDLKPANVKVTRDGAVKLLDFGIAKALETEDESSDIGSSPTFSKMTQPGILLGTAAYMSPEQAKGRTVDRRTDIWAFGCVLFEMLTGRMTFAGESVTDTLAEIIKGDPNWSSLPADTPKTIEKLLRRCLNKNPKQRLQAIGDARISIEEVLADPEETRPQPALPSRRPRTVIGWVGGFLLGASLATVAGMWAVRSHSAASAMHFSAVTSFAGVQAQPALSPDGRSVAFISNKDGHYNVYVGLVRGGNVLQITHDSNMKSHPSWSPDGATLAYAQLNDSGTMDVWEVPALGGAARKVLLDANDPTWSPDGHLVYQNQSDNAIWTSGPQGEDARLLVKAGAWGRATQPRVSPDGQLVAIAVRGAGPHGELAVADVKTGTLRLLTHDNALALSPSWSPDSRFIYFSSSRGGTLNIWKIGVDGTGLRQITAGEGDDAELDVSSDGKRMVFATLRMNIGLAQVDLRASGASSVKVLAGDPARNSYGPTYSPDGKRIAYFTNLKGAENESIFVADADGENATVLVRDSRRNIFPRWSPDQTQLYFSSSTAQSADFRSVSVTGGAPQVVSEKAASYMTDVSPNGELLFLSNTEISALDPRDGKTRILGKQPAGFVMDFARWVRVGDQVAYPVDTSRQMDPNAGIWVTDFKSAPRQVFHGNAVWLAVDAKSELFILKRDADLTGELWRVNADGSGPVRVATIPLLYDPNYNHEDPSSQMDVSPDGTHLIFQSDQVLQENIGMIENLQ
jgi:serine/threonine protein kinase